MKVFKSMAEVPVEFKSAAMTIGNFDGVHIGHRSLISELQLQAENRGLKTLILSFEPHPMKVLHPNKPFSRLLPVEDMIEQMRELGIDALVLQPFTLEFSKLSAEDFFQEHLIKNLEPKYFLLGPDFRFGKNREGDFQLVKEWSQECQVDRFVAHKDSGEKISSTMIRQALADGDLQRVNALLGRPYQLTGKVIQGEQRGRQIGFPTANMDVDSEIGLPLGVYASRVKINKQTYSAVTNVGYRPTFGDQSRPNIEVHILDFNQDLYGQSLSLFLLSKVRDEKKFSGVDTLKTQILEDVSKTRAYIQEHE